MPTYLPNAYMQHGAACKAKPGGAGCFLADGQRDVLIRQLADRINDAKDAYLSAIKSMQVELLVHADDDLPWLAMLLLDVATMGIATAATRGLKQLVKGGEGALTRLVRDAGLQAGSQNWAAIGLRGVRAIDDKHLEQGAKLAIDPLKKLAQVQVKQDLALARTSKTEMTAELIALRSQVSNGFQKYRETMPGIATDAELLTLFHCFDAAIQSEQLYSALLAQKMTRFRKSGVTKIGRMPAGRDDNLRAIPELEDEMGKEVLRDTRVVWVQYVDGGPAVLRYEQHDGDRVHSVLHPDGEHHPRKTRPTFGPGNPITEASELGRPVPVEFHAAALSRHAQIWGAAPSTIQVRDPYWGFFNEVIKDSHENARSSVTKQARPLPEPARGPFVDALPPGAPVVRTTKEPT
ncbi:MAG: hypothetical protein H0T42_32065 [Deltaproteobacteria bacterium]|nr:hypothetical protein [Deltaproteobacteria bacterium]